jgi:hypothetical protein
VNIEIRYFDDCPNWKLVRGSINEITEEIGLDAEVVLTIVDTPEMAERLSFRGSPTVVIDGTDPWDNPDAPIGLSCRVYRTEEGFSGSPTTAQLRDALEGAR